MQIKSWKRQWSLWILLLAGPIIAYGQSASDLIPIYQYESQYSDVRIYPAVQDGQKGIMVEFVGSDDLHYYATEDASPAPGLNLKISASAEGVEFAPAVFPEYKIFKDPALEKDIPVYVGNFKVFIPAVSGFNQDTASQLKVSLSAIACTSKLCLQPTQKTITASITPNPNSSDGLPKLTNISAEQASSPWQSPAPSEPQEQTQTADSSRSLAQTLTGWKEEVAGEQTANRSVPFYFVLAILAGLSINIMPCVLPIIPLIIMRLVSQAKESPAKRISLGLSFCFGIVLFFAAFALISVIITLSTGSVIDLNSLYRQPNAVIILFLVIVFLALVFLDVLTVTLPSSISNKQQSIGSGFAGSIGLGFFAGLLSTPCSGALLGAVLVWAQSQPLYVSSTAIILMGIGMALPYAVLVSIPKLLTFIPRPGAWMEIFKKTGGFLLLIIAVKFTLAALTKDRLINVLMYGVIFSFCVWMWGQWVTFSSPALRKWLVRTAALIISVAAGFWLLPAPQQPIIEWHKYDPAAIEKALQEDQPVVLKFTADWCTNCKVVEKRVYQQIEIAKLLQNRNVLSIKADTTQAQYPASIDFKSIFGEAGNVPVTILLDPKTKTMIKLRGIFKPEQLKEAVNTIP